MTLLASQHRAVAFANARGEAGQVAARATIAAIFRRAGIDLEPDAFVEQVHDRARLTLSFHPDRLARSGRSVVDGLLQDGEYRSQFETGLSNGSLTAFAGGARDEWERTLFGGAYHEPSIPPDQRPKYGGLDLWHHADGACPRFGSCFFALRPEVLSRATLTWGDSHLGPLHVGTANTFDVMLAPLLETLVATGEVLGRGGLDVRSLVAAWLAEGDAEPTPPRMGRALDAYIEAQIHGPIVLARDVSSLAIDPSFDGTEVGASLSTLAARHRFPLVRRPPLRVSLSTWQVPETFRGPAMRPIAERVVERFGADGLLDAATIGRAAVSLARSPEAWADRGETIEETRQLLKQLWHVVVAYGQVG